MLIVHHLQLSQSERIPWLCEELGIPYELRNYARDPVTRLAPAEYKALHPIGTAPIITDGALVLAESAAIIQYIIAKYGAGRLARPPEHPEFANYLFWLNFANASLMTSMMGGMLGAAGGAPGGFAAALEQRTERGFRLVEQRLGEAEYFAGAEFTAADINMLFPLTTMRMFAPRDIGGMPNLRRYLRRIGDRPAYRRAMAKSDPTLAPLLG